ncbi:hypothetical protein EYF80_008985 [Liparis tanakae]|uniref:Uncharacterized protein n=1 Tax=Liparis tanakae TaxID=230148 RepID=A0A4Z2ISD2_9TELE|nr:hypothetical protein EYF80_008985 [Liparis tanakae]
MHLQHLEFKFLLAEELITHRQACQREPSNSNDGELSPEINEMKPRLDERKDIWFNPFVQKESVLMGADGIGKLHQRQATKILRCGVLEQFAKGPDSSGKGNTSYDSLSYFTLKAEACAVCDCVNPCRAHQRQAERDGETVTGPLNTWRPMMTSSRRCHASLHHPISTQSSRIHQLQLIIPSAHQPPPGLDSTGGI